MYQKQEKSTENSQIGKANIFKLLLCFFSSFNACFSHYSLKLTKKFYKLADFVSVKIN